MIDPRELIPVLAANYQWLTPWEQKFCDSIQERLANKQKLSRKQHDKLCVIHTRLECANKGPRTRFSTRG